MNNTLSVATCPTDEDLDPNYGDIAHENWQCESCRSSALRQVHTLPFSR